MPAPGLYKLMSSQHIYKDFTAKPFVRPDGLKIYPTKTCVAGDIIVSSQDLCAKFVNKFQYLGSAPADAKEGKLDADPPPAASAQTPVKPTRAELEAKTEAQLRDLAAEVELDLTGATTKAKVIDRLLAG